MQTFFPIVVYGDGYYQGKWFFIRKLFVNTNNQYIILEKGVEPTEEWRNTLMIAKEELLDRIVIYNRAT